MPNLRDHIQCEIQNDNINEIFTITDIISIDPRGDDCYVCGVKYPKSSIREILANHSIGPGDRKGQAVKNGQIILFVKLGGKGVYSVFDEDGLDIEQRQDRKTNKSPKQFNMIENLDYRSDNYKHKIADEFIDYVRNKPYRMRKNLPNSGVWIPENGPVVGWQNRLNEYSWAGKNWKNTSIILNDFIVRIDSVKKSENANNNVNHAEKIYSGILKWGNPKGRKRDGKFVMDKLNELWSKGITEVDSTLTKLYAFAKPDEYIIYDSRVATAILSIAEDIYRYKTINGQRIETVNKLFHPAYPHLGVYAGSGGTRPRAIRWSKWPNAYRNINAQLDANDLCKRIVEILNTKQEDNRSNWKMREVEAVLFMEGY